MELANAQIYHALVGVFFSVASELATGGKWEGDIFADTIISLSLRIVALTFCFECSSHFALSFSTNHSAYEVAGINHLLQVNPCFHAKAVPVL